MKIRTFDTVQKGNEYIAKIKANHSQFDDLEKMLNIGLTRSLTVDDLSRCAIKMSGYLVSVTDIINELVAAANEAYTYRKYKFLWEFSQLSKTMSKTDREQVATEKSFEEYEEELVCRFVADYFKSKFDAYDKFISVLQSKIGLEKSMLNKL